MSITAESKSDTWITILIQCELSTTLSLLFPKYTFKELAVKSILLGNGINIQFGGDEYHNRNILNRIENNLKTNKYMKLFGNKLEKDELDYFPYILSNLFNSVINGEYDEYCINCVEKSTLDEIKNIYNNSSNFEDIGMEFYFFALRLFNYRFKDNKLFSQSIAQGMKQLLLDGIYNNGKIQIVYKNMNNTKPFFKKFDKIFTVNYDNNIEKLTGKEVTHLHGNFSVLHPEYDINTIYGFDKLVKNILITPLGGLEHVFCNAIMGFSGETKKEIVDKYYNQYIAITEVIKLDKLSQIKLLEEMKNKDKNAFEVLELIFQHRELTIPHYHFDQLLNATGELYIVGLSPYNDKHLFDTINNSLIDNVIYYYKDISHQDVVKKAISKKIEFYNVVDLWKNTNFIEWKL